MRTAALVIVLLSATGAQAQAYRCTVDGKTVFQQAPCSDGQRLRYVPDAPAEGSREARVATAIARREVFIGMTRDEVLRSWGPPSKNNKTIRATSVSEQWVYDRVHPSVTQYLYFEDAVLRTIQSPE